jgi:hypothetical protein
MNKERQAELKLAYKLNPPAMGIFVIKHIASGKAMIGSSRNVDGILNRHRFNLNFGKHPIRALQEDWRKFGESGFVFDVLEVVKQRDDPAFDGDAELQQALLRWQQSYPPGTASSYL